MRVLKYQLIFLSNILLCALSVVVYVNSPIEYSYGYNLLILVFFLLANFVYFNVNKSLKAGVGFELIFFISFLMCNFIYPVFYYTDNPTISLFQFDFNEKVINKSTALAFLGYCFYILFSSDYNNKTTVNRNMAKRYEISEKVFLSIIGLSFFFFLGFYFTGGFSKLMQVYQGNGSLDEVAFSSYLSILFDCCTLLVASLVFLVKGNRFRVIGLFYLALVVMLYLLTGSRGTSISILLILLVGYSKYIKEINSLVFYMGIISSAIFMYIISILRVMSGGYSDSVAEVSSQFNNIFDPFLDIIINNRNLYVLVDFVDENSSVYFLNIFSSVIGVMPGLSFIINYFSIPEFIVSGRLSTYLQFGNNPPFGLGTSMVGEAYLSFGLVGVILVFSLIGGFVRYLRFSSNFYSNLILILLTGFAIFLVRSDYLFFLRKITWSLLIFYIVTMILSSYTKKRGRS